MRPAKAASDRIWLSKAIACLIALEGPRPRRGQHPAGDFRAELHLNILSRMTERRARAHD